ncbi:MAG: cupin [Candidatus Dormiibacterota bacterium]|jgi:hypothetical protein
MAEGRGAAEPGITALPAEQDPQAYFAARGLRSSGWAVGPRTWFPEHRHRWTKHLFVIRGRISFNGLWVEAGEGVRIQAGADHEAFAGDAGVECVEAFETAG